uniref:Uncharacterized protein n=1 Tax=Arundo donax TaxID=35708 RepID=A0A0A9FT82_ARUDO
MGVLNPLICNPHLNSCTKDRCLQAQSQVAGHEASIA